MPLLFLLALFAIADFALLFTIGAKIGLLASLAWIIVSAAFGIHLIRRESLLTLQRARERMAAGEIPSDELMAGASFLLAGILLIAPGFLSDIVGLLCLLPGSSQLMRRWSGRGTRHAGGSGQKMPGDWDVRRHNPESASHHEQAPHGSTPIEGEYLGKDR
ncbi:MAG: FxsA family protein [Pseudomonadota bacterium]|nr:FxsA family protein [Pseudomonadota bacterium]